MDPNPPPGLTQPSEARARALLDERTESPTLVARTGTILTPDPVGRSGHAIPNMTPDVFTRADAQAMREAIAVIDGFSFRAMYGTPSEEAGSVPPAPPRAPPPEPTGPPTHWSPSTVESPSRDATMMYSAPPAYRPPTIPWTDEWPTERTFPDPLTIERAREHLVEAFRQVPCLWTPDAGNHGYAWMVERQTNWNAREGLHDTQPVVPPVRPAMPPVGCAMLIRARYDQDYNTWMDYSHMMREGIAKLQACFGRTVFAPLQVRRHLPSHLTPRALLDYLTTVYAPVELHHQHVRTVKAMAESRYDAAQPVEDYFATLQQAKDDAVLLNIGYTDAQLMFYAKEQFERVLGGETTAKIERKWFDLPLETRSWIDFKMFWIKAILRHKYLASRPRGAHHVSLERTNNDLASTMETVASVHHDNQVLAQQQVTLAAQVARLSETPPTAQPTIPDDISALTDLLGRVAALGTATPTTSPTTSTSARSSRNRPPRTRPPRNEGSGPYYGSYCWKCGCNCTHWTRRCGLLNQSEKAKYRDANFDNRMDGSTKFLDRRGRYKNEFSDTSTNL